MKTMPLSGHWLKFVALACCWLASILSVQAQSAATGTVQGRVFNPSSQQYVRIAEVRLEGTDRVTYTENDGSFQFGGVPAGTANVSVSFTGYNTAKESFNVTAGQTAMREINLISTSTPEMNKEGVI